MVDTHGFEVAATLVLLTFRPQNDSSILRILHMCYCNVLLQGNVPVDW